MANTYTLTPRPRRRTSLLPRRHDDKKNPRHHLAPTQHAGRARFRGDPAHQAFVVLRMAFTAAPIVFGADKFAHLLVDWDRYLAPVLVAPLPVTAHQVMYAVGVVEILAGLLVAVHPRLGAIVVSAWLAGIVVNLLLIPGFFDIALRDTGLLLAAVALQRLSTRYDSRGALWPLRRS